MSVEPDRARDAWIRPRVDAVPARGKAAGPGGVIVMSVVSAVSVLIALGRSGGESAIAASIAVIAITGTLCLAAYTFGVRPGALLVRDAPGGVDLVPQRRLELAMALFVLVSVVAGAVIAWTGFTHGVAVGSPGRRVGGPAGVALMGVALYLAVRHGFRRRGMRLTPEGLEGYRGGPRFAVPWDEILDAVPSNAHGLTILTATGPAQVWTPFVGADAQVLAGVVKALAEDASARAALADGVAGLAALGR